MWQPRSGLALLKVPLLFQHQREACDCQRDVFQADLLHILFLLLQKCLMFSL